MIAGGSLAGGLVGAGMALLLFGDDDGSATPYLTATSLGATAGYGLTFAAVAPAARRPAAGRSGNWDIQLSPVGLLGLTGKGRQSAPGGSVPVPLVQVRRSF